MNRLKVLIVDTSIMYRKMISAAIQSMIPKAVIHYAVTEDEAREKLVSGNYRMVMVDTSIGDDILQFVSNVQTRYPHIHLVLMGRNSRTEKAIAAAAIDMGAHAYMVKPIHADYETNVQTIYQYFEELIQVLSDEDAAPVRGAEKPAQPLARNGMVSMVMVAASTGGPSTIKTLLTRIEDTNCPPILVVQHMPAIFTKSLAESLDHQSRLVVKEAEEDEMPLSGHVYIAPGGKHMVIKPNRHIGLTETAFVNGVRPSADVLFGSVADVHKGEDIVAVILTGMGKDGALGVQKLKAACRCLCIVQSRETCVVFGMPREVVERGLADREEDVEVISEIISNLCDKGIADDES